jgi:hypothetical protein
MKWNNQMKRCSNCAHFLPDEIYAGEVGNCHIHAPVLNELTGYGVWPRVLPTDSCGEHCRISPRVLPTDSCGFIKLKKEEKRK